MRAVPLLLFITCVAAKEKWSWGVIQDGRSATPSSQVVFIEKEPSNSARIAAVEVRSQATPATPAVPATQSNRQARKIEVVDKPKNAEKSDGGKTEPRFFGLKKKLCKHGLAINCPDGYDLLEVQDPYGAYSAYPTAGHYGGHHASVGHYGTGGISADQVLAVQPVALQPVGTPIQAVPLGPAGGSVGAHLGGGYGAGIPHAGGIGIGPHAGGIGIGPHAGGIGIGTHTGGYGLPQPVAYPSYGPSHSVPVHGTAYQSPQEVYSPPSHDGHFSEVGFSDSFPAYDPEPSYDEIPQRDVSYGEPQVVKHYHTHTHIHKGGGTRGIGIGPYGKDISFSESHLSKEIGARPIRSHTLPVVEPHSAVVNSLRRGNCECVPSNFCPPSEIVGRTSNLPRLDARNNPSDIRSTASNKDKDVAASETNQVVVDPPKVKKTKREVKTNFKIFNDTEARQVLGTYRIRHTRRSKTCSRGEVCCRSRGFDARELTYSCGKKNAAGVLGRVRNARYEVQEGDTQFGEYPWQAAILKRESQEVIYVCGGALINDRHIITAAHCIDGMSPGELKVRLGEWDVNRKTEFYDHIETGAKDIIIHPDFYSGTLSNDVAIITLEQAIDFAANPHINPVCLPHSQSDFTNHHCYVTGWGKDAFGSNGNFQFILKEVEVPVWGNEGCEASLRKTRLGSSYELDRGMVCAGGEEGKDACKGDGGGPLVCATSDGSMELAGVVSWGIGCGERGIPGVYVNVPYYIEWISNILKTF